MRSWGVLGSCRPAQFAWATTLAAVVLPARHPGLASIVGIALHVDDFAPAPHRVRGRLDYLDDAQSEIAVGLRGFRMVDAVDEMLAFDVQRLGTVQLGRPHVARAVADPHLLDLRRIVRETHALVVDLDLLAGLEVVVHDHLLAAADQDAAHLDRREPAHVEVGDHSRVVEQREVREVLGGTREVVDAARRNRCGVLTKQEVEDRKVVHREVGDHADVALEQPEIDAGRVVVEHRAEFAGADDLGDLAHGAGVDERVVHQQHQLALLGFRDKLARFIGRLGHRLLEPEVLTRLQHRHAQREVCIDRSRDRDRIDARVVEQVLVALRGFHGRKALLHHLELFCVEVRDGSKVHAWRLGKIANKIRTPIPVAHHSNIDHGRHTCGSRHL